MENEKIIKTFRKLILGVTLFGVGYFIGNYKGFKEGNINGKESIIESLAMDRSDIYHSAKFAKNLNQQKEILYYAGAINTTFDFLENDGHFKDVSDFVYEEAFKIKRN